MARTSAVGTPPGVNVANTVYAQLRALNANQDVQLRRLVVVTTTAPTTPPVWLIQRSSLVGTVTTFAAGRPFEPAAASLAQLDYIFSGQPTLVAGGLDVGGFPAAVGNAWVFSFLDAPIITRGTGTGICLVNTVATGATLGAFAVSAIWDE